VTEGLDVFALPLDAVTAVEASAGTGKTTTITRLYLRLLLERELTVERILVLTYTRAATGELRARLRTLLGAARAALACGPGDDAFLGALLGRLPDRVGARRRIEDALRSFDLAAVFTIHGFCQRVLAARAFESGEPFDAELIGDPGDLLAEVVEDFWRRELYGASPLFVEYVLDKKLAPSGLAAGVRRWVGRPYLAVRAAADPTDTAACEAAFAAAWAAARAALGAARALGGPARVAAWLEEAAAWLATETPRLALGKGIVRLAAGTGRRRVAVEDSVAEACRRLVAAHDALLDCFARRASALRARLLAQARDDLEARKRRLEVQCYDDLLLRLCAALEDPRRGDVLAAALRADYPAVLVDEFQDTDPVQYAILRRIWGGQGLPVFLVGDPKQAIYGFRGADVFAYLRARREAKGPYPLDVTWRAAPRLVEALNALFGRAPHPFLLPQIDFRSAKAAAAAKHTPLTGTGDGDAPLRLWVFDGAANKKEEARDRAARAVAAEVARLLALGACGAARLGEGPLGGGDVAVLVRTNEEGRRVREALTACGVASVQQAVDSVFHAPAAAEVERVLLAVAEPANAALVRAALATTLLGATGEALVQLAADEEAWARRVEAFQRWHALWRTHGFARMFHTLLAEEGVAARLLALPDGERRLTDVLHLAELLAERARAQPGGLDGLVEWFAERRAERGDASDDAQQLRLESDEQLVTIVTIHKSKGLEYPIVFCPFLWDGWLQAGEHAALEFHDPAADDRPCLDLGSPQQAAAAPLARREELAERLRLLYVALTRARERCYVVWGRLPGAETSPLAWLLHPPGPADDPVAALARHVESLDAAAWRAPLDRLAEEANGAIAVEPLPAPASPGRPVCSAAPAALAARPFTGQVSAPWSVVSFSSLTAGSGAETPDYDAGPPAPRAPAGRRDAFAFPRGARAGSCLHAILERIDFTDTDLAARRTVVEAALAAHGFEREWAPAVCDLLARTLATALDAKGTIRLERVARADRRDEIEFHYPLAGLRPAALRRLLDAHGIPTGPLGVAGSSLRGYMKGFIDLVFACDGRYWIADYKSNWLGDAPEDYAAERLPAVMAAHGYHLQYLIYTVVVHRWLRQRLAGYDYDTHVGGVFYLFLRGLDPASGPARGVFHARPGRALVEALDALMAGGEG
jgi:exodeoxyribonuclease V beta subunit